MEFSRWDKIRAIITICINPRFWFQNEEYSASWDRKLRLLMTEFKFVEHKQYTHYLGHILIWTSNYPYACFHPYEYSKNRYEFRPSRYTIALAKIKLNRETESKESKRERLISSL